MSSKINWLLNHTSPGSIVLQSWLTKHGISPQLAAKYNGSDWLHKLANGVYARSGKKTGWHEAVSALSKQLSLPVALAGISSLAYQGKSHYLQLNNDSVWISVPNKSQLPSWFKKFHQLDGTHLNSGEPPWKLITHKNINPLKKNDFITLDVNGVEINSSRQELAIYEMLGQVPKSYSFEYAAELMQGLINLSPRKVQSLLGRSSSVRTNRLYLFLGHYYLHPWVARIQEENIQLGSGNRQIVLGGQLDKKYHITVPKSFALNRENHNG